MKSVRKRASGRQVGAVALLLLTLVGCTTAVRKPWVGTWRAGNGADTSTLLLSANGKGLLGTGYMATPITWETSKGVAEIRVLELPGMPSEPQRMTITGKIVEEEGRRILELTGMADKVQAANPRRLTLQSRDDPAEEVAAMENLLRQELSQPAKPASHTKTNLDRAATLEGIQKLLAESRRPLWGKVHDQQKQWWFFLFIRDLRQTELTVLVAKHGQAVKSANLSGTIVDAVPDALKQQARVMNAKMSAALRAVAEKEGATVSREIYAWRDNGRFVYAEEMLVLRWSGWDKRYDIALGRTIDVVLSYGPRWLTLETST